MKGLKCSAITLLLLLCFHTIIAQNSNSVRQEVINRLKKIKPPDTPKYIYKLTVPQKIPDLPENLRLDIIYKIGHYEFQYVALRFEREKGKDFVNVTRFIYGSALNFYKPYSKGENYNAAEGKLTVKDFNDLLNLAYTLFQSNIEKIARRNLGYGSGSATMSSGDGSIAINLSDKQNNAASIINETGTLHAGDLKDRISNGYEDLRVHLFWEVFYDYLEKNNIFADLEKAKAEEIAISRLKEPLLTINYRDYYRQALYVELLGEIGSEQSLPILKKLTENNGLEKDWDKYLNERAQKAIEKIRSRQPLKPG